MKFIYGIICHKLTNPLQFLITELSKSDNSIILIHVDKKSNISSFYEKFGSNKKVHFIQNRIDVQWGGYSQIEATLELLKIAENFDYKYFSLLSGDDIPLKSVYEIEGTLNQSQVEYLGHDNIINPTPRVQYIYPKCFFAKNKTIYQKVKCKIFHLMHNIGLLKQNLDGIPKLYKGTSWFSLTKEAIVYILEYLQDNPAYDRSFRHSYCGDEVYFHTIIYNSQFKDRLNLDYELNPPAMALRYIDWRTGPDFPRTLDSSDFQKMKSSGLLFARKVDSDISEVQLSQFFKN